MHLEAMIVWTWRLWSVEFGDALGDHDRVNSKMCLEAVIEWIWRCTWRPRSCNTEMHLKAVIERVWRCPWRLRSWNSEMHLEAVIERVWGCTLTPWSTEIGGLLARGRSGGGRSGGRCNGSWDSIHWLTCNRGNVGNWVLHGLLRDERLAGSGRQSILGWCSTRCMLYSVYAVLGVCCTRCELLIMEWRGTEGWLNFVFLGDGRVEDEKERDGAIHHEKRGRREFRMRVNVPSPIWQVQIPIWRVITPIRSHPTPIRQVVPLISHIRSYPPHRAHFHPPSLSFSSPTLPSSQNIKLSHPSLSLHAMIMSWHRVQHTPSAACNQNSLSSFHSHDDELTTECSFSFLGASLQDRPPLASSPWVLRDTVTLSHSHVCESTN